MPLSHIKSEKIEDENKLLNAVRIRQTFEKMECCKVELKLIAKFRIFKSNLLPN
jgi:hypothetical protein